MKIAVVVVVLVVVVAMAMMTINDAAKYVKNAKWLLESFIFKDLFKSCHLRDLRSQELNRRRGGGGGGVVVGKNKATFLSSHSCPPLRG